MCACATLIAACSPFKYSPADSPYPVRGQGGFIDYQDGGIRIYSQGLPAGENCRLLGFLEYNRDTNRLYFNSQDHTVLEKVREVGGNVATKVAESSHANNTIGATPGSGGGIYTGLIQQRVKNGYEIYWCEI